MSTITPLPTPGTPRERVAAQIRALLAFYGRTQTDLAVTLGLSQSQLSKRLRGVIAFDLDELVSIADYFGVTVGRLLGEPGSKNPGPGGPGGSHSDGGDPLTLPYADSPQRGLRVVA